jgi:hypothetical protein
MAMLKAAGIRGHFEIGNLIMSYLPAPLLPAIRSFYPNRIGASAIDLMLYVPTDPDTMSLIESHFQVVNFSILASLHNLRDDMHAIFKHQAWHKGLAPGYEREYWNLDALEISMLEYLKWISLLRAQDYIRLKSVTVRGGTMEEIFHKMWGWSGRG